MANLNFGVRFRAYTQQFVQKVKGTRDSVRDAYQDMREQARIAREQMGGDFENTSRAGDGLANAIKSIRNQLVGMAAAAVGIYSVQRGLTAIVSTGAQFETLRTQLNSVMGSIEAGEQATAWVKDFTKTTPFDLAQVTEGFIKLKAFGLDPMDGTYQAIVDQASKLGGSQETLTGITLALGQAWAKQKLQGEEILQLVERGVPVWELLEKATGKNTQQLQALSEAGKLGRKEIKALIEEIGRSADGAAADQMKTWNGMMSNLKDQWADFLNTIAEAGVLDYLKEQITALNQAVADLGEDGLREYAKNIADAIIGTAEALKTGAQAIWDYRYALGALVGAIAAVKLARLVKEINDYSTVVIDAAKETRAWAAAQAALSGSNLVANIKAAATILATRFNIAVAVAAWGTKQLADAWRESEMAAARETIALSEKAGQYAKIAAEQAKYAGTYIKTAEELERADQAGLDAYEARLSGAQKYYQALLDEAKAAAEYGQDSDEQLRYATENLAAIEAAMVSLKAAQDAVTNNAPALTEAAQEIINQFDLMRSKGDSVKEALDKAFAGVNFETVADVQAVGDAIQSLQQYAKATGDQIDTSLSARLQKLSMTELEQFRMSAQRAFTATGEQGALLGRMMDATAGAAIAKLGLDITQLKTGMTSVGQEAIQAFTIAAQSGTLSATQIETAFAAALGKIKTQTGIETLTTAITNLGEQGQLSAEQIQYYLELAGDAATRLGDDFSVTEQRLADGLGRLGLSMDYLRTGMTTAGADAVKSFGLVQDELKRTGVTGKEAAEITGAAFDKTLARISTARGLDELKTKLKKAAQDGTISWEEYRKKLKEIERKYGDLAKASVSSAAVQEKSLQRVANQASKTAKSFKDKASFTDKDTEANKENTEANDKNAESTDKKSKSLGSYTHALFMAGKSQKEFAEMGSQMAAEFENIWQRVEDAYKGKRITSTMQYLREMKKAEDAMNKMAREAIASWNQQEQAIRRVEAALKSGQRMSESVLDGLDLIDSQRLEGVRNAIQRMNQEAKSVRDTLTGTVTSLEQELANLRGQTLKAEQIEQERKMQQLREQYEKAREVGDAEAIKSAKEALSLQQQIYQERVKRIKAEEQERKQAAAPAAESTKSGPEKTTGRTVRLQLNVGTGEPVEGQYSEADADRLLRQLRDKGAVTR